MNKSTPLPSDAVSIHKRAVRSMFNFFSNVRKGIMLTCNAWNRAICGGSGFWRKGLLALMPLLLSTHVLAQQVIKVSQSAWLALIPPERALIQQKYIVDLVEQDSFGIVIDNQGVNESTPGTNVGSNLGGAVGNAAYIDNAIRRGNYSAMNQLGAGILGALVGSTLDSRPNARYHFRYAVKLGSGDIKYFDEFKTDAFRHPVGVCVSVPYIALVEQQLCTQTAAFLRTAYLPPPATQAIDVAPTANSPSVENAVAQKAMPEAATVQTVVPAPAEAHVPTVAPPSIQVNCKLGTLAPVRTSAEKCALINGSPVQ